MNNIFNEEHLDEEQLDYVNNEYFSGFKRYKNWQKLPLKLKQYLPKYIDDKNTLNIKVEENTLKLKALINVVYSLFSKIATNDNIEDNMKQLSSFYTSLQKSEKLNEQQLKTIVSYSQLSNANNKIETLEAIFDDLKQQYQHLKNSEAHLRQAKNTLTLCCDLINQYDDDKSGIRYKEVKKTKVELDKELKALNDAVQKKKDELKKLKRTDLIDAKKEEVNELQTELENINLYKTVRVVKDTAECLTFINSIEFTNNKVPDYTSHCSQKLLDIIHRVHSSYTIDNRPWVIGYSGGKDSSAVATLVYLSLLAMNKESRTKNIYLVASDTLVETPKVVDHIDHSLEVIGKQAKRDNLPITTHKVLPEANQSFWACLLGKGYPAPTKSFRWCTERMKINPVSDFIKSKISQHDEVIVTLGSRSEESASRAQVIAKHKIENSRFARHTTLANAYIYTPIDTWSMDDVWKILRACSLEVTTSPLGIGKKWSNNYELEWENPWGAKNLTLWNLYKDASDQGECPMVIDDSTPSCGNSRFGCWTCTVVTKDRAMQSLISNGEDWMLPLLKFRDLLAYTNIPENKDEYRNFKRRTGKVHDQVKRLNSNIRNIEDIVGSIELENNQKIETSEQTKEVWVKDDDAIITYYKYDTQQNLWLLYRYIPGPYWLKYRQKWLKELLVQEKQFNEEGHEIQLITEPELHAIRQEWLNDPNEPDWDDSLPAIYREVYGKDLKWVINDNSAFDKQGANVLTNLCHNFNIVPQMVMKLLDLEVSMEGLSRRKGMQEKITTILKQDWGTMEEIREKKKNVQAKAGYDVHEEEIRSLNAKLTTVEKLLKKEF